MDINTRKITENKSYLRALVSISGGKSKIHVYTRGIRTIATYMLIGDKYYKGSLLYAPYQASEGVNNYSIFFDQLA